LNDTAAIRLAHCGNASPPCRPSEATQLINLFDALLPLQQQDILDFPRSL
jgi:hypothetical protein